MTALLESEKELDTLSARRAFWGVMLAFAVHGLVASTWFSRIVSIKSTLHLSDGALGLSLLGAPAGSLLAIPLCGSLVARYGSRSIAKWTGIGFSLTLFLPAAAGSAFTLFLALLIYGALAGANDVAMNAQAVGTERLLGTPVMSRFHAMFSVGGILGAAAGGVIASRGVHPFAHLASGACVFAALAMLAPRFLVDTHAEPEITSPRLLRHLPPALIALCAIGFCIFLSEGAMADWTGVYLKQVLGASDGFAPVGYAVFSAAMALFRLFGDAITLRLGRPQTIRLGATVAAAGIALALAVNSPAWALVGFAAAGAGFSSIIPIVFAAGGRVGGVSEGPGVATVSGLGYLGFVAGPPGIGFISQVSSLRIGLLTIVGLSAAAAMLVSVVERTSPNRTWPGSARADNASRLSAPRD
jgi:MFS family permease